MNLDILHELPTFVLLHPHSYGQSPEEVSGSAAKGGSPCAELLTVNHYIGREAPPLRRLPA